MRPLKFRAWDKSVNTMWPVSSISLASDGTVIVYTEQPYDFGDIEVEMSINTPVMQFTGLKDKNGKEIYEGDVVRAIYDNLDVRGREQQVVWIEYRACFGLVPSTPYDFTECSDEHAKHSEVIGNVWGNPELLAGK